ncbi:E3 ubiquitin-protein ligase TRIM31-like [Ruditapes philippinarum]|uniref:E3 ubiquitin-protein ligase TRIM31-like n=1 Tax=Ruditapes philippinarum TaxID=129788 RepID=UPI00295B81BC|nr:E3 ubiquitin-protein ligase TRIM31-like [Ruditapes philippinarum]
MAESEGEIGENDKVSGRIKECLCQPCLIKDKQTVADKFCSTCNEFQCTDCSSVHDLLPILKSHKLVNAKEANASRVLLDMKGLDQCDQHKEILKFFCEDENKLCCSTCAISKHRKCHSVVEVDEIAGNITSRSSTLMEKMKKALQDAEGIARHILNSKDQLAQNVNEIPVKIREMRDKVMQMFDDLELSVAKRAKDLQKESLVNLTKKQSLNEKHLAHVTSIFETIDNVYKNGTSAQKFIAEQNMENEVNVLCRHVQEEIQNSDTATITFHFDDALKLPPLPITEYIPGQLILKSLRQGDANSDNTEITLTPVFSIDLKKTGDDMKEPFITGIDFLPDGRLVAVDKYNKTFLACNEKLEKVGSYQLSYEPMSVVAVSEDEVAITSGSEYIIEFLRVSKANEISLSGKINVSTKYFSVCLKDNRHLMVGTYDEQRPAEIVSLTAGQIFVFNINFPEKTYPLNKSACTYVRSSDKVVLTDRDGHTVYIYDNVTNTRVVVKGYQIKEPCGVAVGPYDTILVCSLRTNSIVQISQTGQILSSHKIDMDNPYRACVSCDKTFLAITNSCEGEMKIQKFKISL